MNELQVETQYDAFYPGTEAMVTVKWDFAGNTAAPAALEIRLVWNTAGKGDRDMNIVQAVRKQVSSPRGELDVTLKLPWGPYSFSGKLISLIWAIEVVAFPGESSVRKEIVIGPNSEEVLIGSSSSPPAAEDSISD